MIKIEIKPSQVSVDVRNLHMLVFRGMGNLMRS